MNILAFKEIETNKFITQQFEETFVNTKVHNLETNEVSHSGTAMENFSDNYFANVNTCFNNLVQFELTSHDETIDKVINR